MNPDLFKAMIDRLQWDMEDGGWLEEYYEGKMSEADERDIMDCYSAVHNSLDHISRKAKYHCEMYEKRVKGKKPIKKRRPVETVKKKLIIAVCINNKGYEDQFEEGVEYIVRKPSRNGTLMIVENMCGETVGMLSERFKIVERETA